MTNCWSGIPVLANAMQHACMKLLHLLTAVRSDMMLSSQDVGEHARPPRDILLEPRKLAVVL